MFAAALAPAAAGAKELTSPYGVFVEGGISDDSRSAVAGIAWTWVQPSKWGAGNASGYLETSIGEWACHRDEGGHYRACSTQFGVTPVIRYQPEAWEHWYMELGIGADVIAPAWKTDQRRFSTEFNFGDHHRPGPQVRRRGARRDRAARRTLFQRRLQESEPGRELVPAALHALVLAPAYRTTGHTRNMRSCPGKFRFTKLV